MALLHSLIDNLRIENMCHQRESFTLKASVPYEAVKPS